jgi:hypothetical protein
MSDVRILWPYQIAKIECFARFIYPRTACEFNLFRHQDDVLQAQVTQVGHPSVRALLAYLSRLQSKPNFNR